MRTTVFWGVVTVALALPAFAQDTGAERLQPVVAARLELQRGLRAQLEETLAPIVAPHRVLVIVEATMDARLRENLRTEETPGTEVQVKPMRQVELPGLPAVRQQIVGAGTPQMEYKVPGRKVTERTSTLDAELKKLVIRVFLDAGVTDAQRAEVKKLVAALAGVEPARGDAVELADLPPATAAGFLSLVPPAWLYSFTALLGAVLLALGLARRQAQGGAEVHMGGGEGGDEVEEGQAAAAVAAAVEAKEAGAALAGGPFAALAGCTPDELAQVAVELPATESAVLLAATNVEARAARRLFELLPPERQLQLGQWLGAKHELARTEVEKIAASAAAALEKVRSRVTLGGAQQLADLLSQAPEATVKRILEDITARDAAMAAAVRQYMPLFEDLAGLEAPAIRAVVTQLDPARLALALANAPQPLKDKVYASVSRRLRAMLESEALGLKAPAADQIEDARKQVELVMRRQRVQKRAVQPTAA